MKVYGCPAEIPAPVVDYTNFDLKKVEEAEKIHREALIRWLHDAGYKGKHTGKILAIPHADGYAQYMLADGSKSCLIHLPYGDGWNSPNAEFLPKKEVLLRIEKQEKLAAFFAKP